MKRIIVIRRIAILMFGMFFGIALHQQEAAADQMLSLVHITCVPEAGYFSIRRFVFVNPPHQPGDDFQPLLSKIPPSDGIYTARQLKAQPSDCLLLSPTSTDQRRQLKVHVEGAYDNKNGQAVGPRQIVEEVEVSVDRKSLGRLYLNAFGYLPDEIDLMEIRFDGAGFWVDKCSYYQSFDPQSKRGCVRENN